MLKRLTRATAVTGAVLPALLVGGAAGIASATPQAPAVHHVATVQQRSLEPRRCRLVQVTKVIRTPGRTVVVRTSKYVCTHHDGWWDGGRYR